MMVLGISGAQASAQVPPAPLSNQQNTNVSDGTMCSLKMVGWSTLVRSDTGIFERSYLIPWHELSLENMSSSPKRLK